MTDIIQNYIGLLDTGEEGLLLTADNYPLDTLTRIGDSDIKQAFRSSHRTTKPNYGYAVIQFILPQEEDGGDIDFTKSLGSIHLAIGYSEKKQDFFASVSVCDKSDNTYRDYKTLGDFLARQRKFEKRFDNARDAVLFADSKLKYFIDTLKKNAETLPRLATIDPFCGVDLSHTLDISETIKATCSSYRWFIMKGITHFYFEAFYARSDGARTGGFSASIIIEDRTIKYRLANGHSDDAEVYLEGEIDNDCLDNRQVALDRIYGAIIKTGDLL